jgi:hypothetical protein
MNNFYKILNYALDAIFQLEQAIPQSGAGKTKKDIILNGIEVAAKEGEGLGVINPVIGAVSTFIDTTVQVLNAAGIFGKSAPAPAA